MASERSVSSNTDSLTTSLATWEEITGEVKEINEDENILQLKLGRTPQTISIVVSSRSTEARIIRSTLQERVGSVVSVLRTDTESKPLVIDIKPEHSDDE